MLFFRFSLLLLLAGGIAGYIISQQTSAPLIENINKKLVEKGRAVTYRRSFRSGYVILNAQEAEIRNQDEIFMINVKSEFHENKKTIKIDSKYCILRQKQQKAFLTENVKIENDDTIGYTSTATIDFKMQTISGNSKIKGIQRGSNYEASGFKVNKAGKTVLTKAKILKNKKRNNMK